MSISALVKKKTGKKNTGQKNVKKNRQKMNTVQIRHKTLNARAILGGES